MPSLQKMFHKYFSSSTYFSYNVISGIHNCFKSTESTSTPSASASQVMNSSIHRCAIMAVTETSCCLSFCWIYRFEKVLNLPKCKEQRVCLQMLSSLMHIQIPQEKDTTCPDPPALDQMALFCFGNTIGKYPSTGRGRRLHALRSLIAVDLCTDSVAAFVWDEPPLFSFFFVAISSAKHVRPVYGPYRRPSAPALVNILYVWSPVQKFRNRLSNFNTITPSKCFYMLAGLIHTFFNYHATAVL